MYYKNLFKNVFEKLKQNFHKTSLFFINKTRIFKEKALKN